MHRILLPSLAIMLFASCSTNNVEEDGSLGLYFDSAGVKGCFGLFNNSENNFIIYNLPRYRDSSYTPASTFKIVNSLIGLETGKISDEKFIRQYFDLSPYGIIKKLRIDANLCDKL